MEKSSEEEKSEEIETETEVIDDTTEEQKSDYEKYIESYPEDDIEPNEDDIVW